MQLYLGKTEDLTSGTTHWCKWHRCPYGCHLFNLALSAPNQKSGGTYENKMGEIGTLQPTDCICLFHGKRCQSNGIWRFLDIWRETLTKIFNGWISSLPVFKGCMSGGLNKYLLCAAPPQLKRWQAEPAHLGQDGTRVPYLKSRASPILSLNACWNSGSCPNCFLKTFNLDCKSSCEWVSVTGCSICFWWVDIPETLDNYVINF